MILLTHPHNVVIVTPPKTASDALHRLFCSGPPWDGMALVGPHHGTVDKHYAAIPNEAVPCKKLLCVRHPLDRLVSLWCHKHRADAYYGFGTASFDDFCQRLAAGRTSGWMWTTTIDELVGDFQPDGLVRCESLVADLRADGLNVESVPRTNTSFRRPWQAYYTPELIAAITPWAQRDCERFGYSIAEAAPSPCSPQSVHAPTSG